MDYYNTITAANCQVTALYFRISTRERLDELMKHTRLFPHLIRFGHNWLQTCMACVINILFTISSKYHSTGEKCIIFAVTYKNPLKFLLGIPAVNTFSISDC